MSQQLVDYETLAKLERAAPKVAATSLAEVRLVLHALGEKSMLFHEMVGMDNRPYWQALFSELTPLLPRGLTPKRVGLICHRIGLSVQHTKPGNRVAWNREQLDILRQYFQMED